MVRQHTCNPAYFPSYMYGRKVKPLQSSDIFKKILLMISVLLSFKVDFLPVLVVCFWGKKVMIFWWWHLVEGLSDLPTSFGTFGLWQEFFSIMLHWSWWWGLSESCDWLKGWETFLWAASRIRCLFSVDLLFFFFTEMVNLVICITWLTCKRL